MNIVLLDCGDFSDETHCGARIKCEEDQFECDNGLCIQHQWVCDGQYQAINTIFNPFSDIKSDNYFDILEQAITIVRIIPMRSIARLKYRKQTSYIIS